MIITADSVLIKIPSAMSRKQALFVEGIRFSIEIADLAHVRLQSTLPRLTKGDQLLPDDRLTASAMLDAWSIVDSLHRLRGLLRQMPGIHKRDRIPPIRAFFDATDKVTELRNTIQHLDTTIPGSSRRSKLGCVRIAALGDRRHRKESDYIVVLHARNAGW
jgi:hypothetical protein